MRGGTEADVVSTGVSSGVRATDRLRIPDVLRGIAIVAMLVAHAAVFLPVKPLPVTFVSSMLNELASPLFALVMGMSAQLLWTRGPRVPLTLLQQVVRGLFLIALGVWMSTWGSWVAIILGHLGVLLIVGAPLLLARTPWLIAIAATLLLLSDPLVRLTRGWLWAYTAPSPLHEVLEWVALSPSYRLLNLLPFFLAGALLIRHGLRRDGLLWAFAGVAVVAYLSWGVAAFTEFGGTDSGLLFDTLRDIGLVSATYVLVVLAATSRRGARFWNALFTPLVACGQVALSLYLLHVGLIALWNGAYGRPAENAWLGWLVIVPGMILVGWLWWRFVGTGPVEWAMGWVTGRRKQLRRTR
ncbi:acyltransferase family protein [Microbacterium sp. NPDC055599]